MRRFFILTILYACIFPLFSQEAVMDVEVGQGMPEFRIIHDDGRLVTMGPYLEKVILITFFSMDCIACQQFLDGVEKYLWPQYNEYVKFSFLPIGVGHRDGELDLYKEKHNYSFSLYPDAYKEIFDLFALGEDIPRSYLIDIDNKVVFISEGYSPVKFNLLLRKLSSLLDSAPFFDNPRLDEPHVEGIPES